MARGFIIRSLYLIIGVCWLILVDTCILQKDDLSYDTIHSIVIFFKILFCIALVINGIIFCKASKKRLQPSNNER